MLAPGLPVSAQAPTRVDVSTRIEAQRFRLKFGTRTQAIELATTARFAALLGEKIGFLRFARNDTTARYRLVFTLDQRVRGAPTPFPEYGFWARLDRPDGTPIELYWQTLRPPAATTFGIGEESDFFDDLDAMLIDPDLAPIRTELLSKVPIATTTFASATPVGWALPLPNDSLCMRRFSIIEVVAVFRTGGGQGVDRPDTARVASEPFLPATPGPRHAPFLRKLFSEPVSAQARDQLRQALANGTVEGKEVYVLDYQRDPNVCRAPLGPDVGGAGGAP
jgi:hypothetical protein